MKMHSVLTIAAAGMAAMLLSGCVVTGRTYYRESDRPVLVQRPRGDVIIVHRAPPAPLVERVPRSPGREYVWVPGYWTSHGDDWVWVGGHYERPPRPGAVWVEPRYDRHGQTDVEFSLGFWK
jgi:hypothetical protein